MRDTVRPAAWAMALIAVAGPSCRAGGESYRDIVQPFADRPVGEITAQTKVMQTFVPDHDKLSSVAVFMATWARPNTCEVVLRVAREGETKEVANRHYRCAEIQDNSWVQVDFEPVENAKGQKFVLTIESPDGAAGNALTAWMGSVGGIYPDGTLSLNDKPLPGALKFTTYHR